MNINTAHKFDFKAWIQRGEKPSPKQNFTHDPRYDELPEVLQAIVSPKQYAWMPNDDKDTEMERFCYPEPEED